MVSVSNQMSGLARCGFTSEELEFIINHESNRRTGWED